MRGTDKEREVQDRKDNTFTPVVPVRVQVCHIAICEEMCLHVRVCASVFLQLVPTTKYYTRAE